MQSNRGERGRGREKRKPLKISSMTNWIESSTRALRFLLAILHVVRFNMYRIWNVSVIELLLLIARTEKGEREKWERGERSWNWSEKATVQKKKLKGEKLLDETTFIEWKTWKKSNKIRQAGKNNRGNAMHTKIVLKKKNRPNSFRVCTRRDNCSLHAAYESNSNKWASMAQQKSGQT